VEKEPSGRKPRADAERNRQRLIEAAKASFARDGGSASLEEIARSAGVGIGTLYRHFPTREALISGVYSDAVGQLSAAAESLAETDSPAEALRRWLLLFVDYLATKKIMANTLTSLGGDMSTLYAATGETLKNAIDTLAQSAIDAGEIKLDVEPFDLLRAIGGVAHAAPAADWVASAKGMVEMLMAGMKRSSP